MQNRTSDITRQYWIVEEQYRSLNTSVLNAIDNHEKVKLAYENNVRNSQVHVVVCTICLLLEYCSKFQYD